MPRPPPAGDFAWQSLDWYPFDHSAPHLSTRIRYLGLRHESVPPDDIEMEKLLRNQGSNILGINESVITHDKLIVSIMFLLISNHILSPKM